MTDSLYIGLMSGTSIDGIDVALVAFTDSNCQLIASLDYPIESNVKLKLSNICSPKTTQDTNFENRIELMAEMDVTMGHLFADAVNAILEQEKRSPSKITAIGSHGQTIRHRPTNKNPFTLQIGDANIIAEKTGITTIADFRRMDIAAGGQGAPLAPAFHNAILRSDKEDRIILNLGGIANITLLPKDKSQPVLGFDTGTANTLLDAWFKKHHPNSADNFDRDGRFASQGKVNFDLLKELLSDPYFSLPYPKSTGPEHFCLDWLNAQINSVGYNIKSEDIQSTLLEFTTQSIVDSIKSLKLLNYRVLACGGGMHNQFLLSSLSDKLNLDVQKTNEFDIDGDYLEAMTFAWLAKQRMEEKPGNLPSVTGAHCDKVLGAVYLK
jgi:anhydro-N-acetylmuramic acid kinase